VKIDSIKQIESVLLCKLNKEPIGELTIDCIISENESVESISEIELEVKKYLINQDSKQKVENPLYYEIKNKRYILINDKDYYIIDKVKESKISGIKTATCYGGEQILARRPIDIEDIGIQLITSDKDNDVYSLDDLLKEVGWKLSYVDEDIAYDSNGIEKMRWQESISGNMLDFVREEISTQFECYPIFNPKERTIALYDLDKIGNEIKICLTKDNYLKSKEKDNDSDNLITVLKLKGSEDLDVSRHIVGGYDFITNFSYFIETKEMSDVLIEALKEYDEIVEIRHEQWLSLTEQKNQKEKQLNIKINEWTISISNINNYKTIKNSYALAEDDMNEAQITLKLATESDKELLLRLEIDELINEIDSLQSSIDNINLLCKYETATNSNGDLIFNEELLSELQEFIFVDTFNDDSYVEPNSLIEKGKKILLERSNPTTTIDIDSMNFMSKIIDNGFRLKWNGELNFCDIVVLIDEDTQQEEFYYFVGYDLNYKDKKLKIKISNKKIDRDNVKTINQWLRESKKMKSLLTTNKYIFNKVKNNKLNIDKEDM
jgi:hypothetical protein